MNTALFRLTRIAPTPSGYLHLGNVLSFAITARLAGLSGARILLRIDDLDRERADPRYIQDIFDTLDFMEIPWHEGPRNMAEFEREYSQLHRIDLYRDALDELERSGQVFACTCSRADIARAAKGAAYPGTCLQKRLLLDHPASSWRFKTDTTSAVSVRELTGTARHAFPADQSFFIVRKKDGFPAYQLASLIDDTHFGVDLIVRGSDLWSSTLAQLELAAALGLDSFGDTVFHHHSLLTAEGGDKLSKSAGALSIQSLRKEGRSAKDIYAMIGRLLKISGPLTHWSDLDLTHRYTS